MVGDPLAAVVPYGAAVGLELGPLVPGGSVSAFWGVPLTSAVGELDVAVAGVCDAADAATAATAMISPTPARRRAFRCLVSLHLSI